MADLADVENALVSFVAAVAYPSGTGSPSITGADTQIYRGWPRQTDLDPDLAAGKLTITVFSGGAEKNTTRFEADWQTVVAPVHQITATVVGNVIALAGTPAVGQYVAAIIAGRAYSVPTTAGDTLATLAARLAAGVNAAVPATSSGSTVTVSTTLTLLARVGSVGTSYKEIRRQMRQFQITLWCPTFTARDTLGAAIDQAFAAINFLPLPLGELARVTYVGTMVSDEAQNTTLYRRDLLYLVEYPTGVTEADYEIISITENVQGSASPADAPVVSSGI